jgi:predicted 2-oxoglutarate/Fe(II)-dependent dioxygenase YbiX
MSVTTQSPKPTAQHRLEPGDRFPDFGLPDHKGAVRSFYQRARGSGTAIFVDSDDALRTALQSAAEAYEAARLDRVVVDDRARAEGFVSLADPTGRFRQGLRGMVGRPSGGTGPRPLAVLLDRNQRILAVSDIGDAGGDLARWALARWSEQPPPAAGEIRQVAPVLTVPNVLSPADCRALIARWHEEGHAAGSIMSVVDGKAVERYDDAVKKRRDHVLSDPAVRKPLMAMVARRLGPEVGKAFCFGSFRFDRVLIACYDAERGDHFRPHRDNTTPATAGRRFALTLNLNSDEYDGGELMFPEYGDYRYKPPAGAAVVFACSLLHEALPVTRGRRFALLSFLLDPADPGAER